MLFAFSEYYTSKNNFRHELLNNCISYKYTLLKRRFVIVKLKMNVGISDGFFYYTNSEIHQILGLCDHINDLTRQLREKSDYEVINQEKILVYFIF